jgi:putative membrane protein
LIAQRGDKIQLATVLFTSDRQTPSNGRRCCMLTVLQDIAAFVTPYEWRPLITLACAGASGLYLRGLVLGARPGFARSLAFLLGIGLMYFVTQTRFDYFSQYVFFIHRGQHLVLHHVAAMLIALSNPLGVLARGTPAGLRERWLRPAWAGGPVQKTYAFIQHPVTAGLLFVGLIYLWLIPSLHFDAMLSRTWYGVMNWSMAVDGVLFWWLVFNPHPPGAAHRSLGYGRRCILLALVAFPQIVLGAYIALSEPGLYDIYEMCGRPFPIDPDMDQTLGGLLTWIPAAMMSAVGVVVVLMIWFWHERAGTLMDDTARRSATRQP